MFQTALISNWRYNCIYIQILLTRFSRQKHALSSHQRYPRKNQKGYIENQKKSKTYSRLAACGDKSFLKARRTLRHEKRLEASIRKALVSCWEIAQSRLRHRYRIFRWCWVYIDDCSSHRRRHGSRLEELVQFFLGDNDA